MTRYETIRKQLGDALTKDYEGHSYGSTQFNVEDASYTRAGYPMQVLGALQAAIPEEYLVQDGLEKILHVTVKYGLVPQAIGFQDVEDVVESFGPVMIELKSLSVFENDDADVVYVACEGDRLRELNTKISQELECVNTRPNYTPHITLAYVQSGKGNEVVDILTGLTEDEQGTLEGITMSCSTLVFSSDNGKVSRVELTKEWSSMDDGGQPPVTQGGNKIVDKRFVKRNI